MLKSYWGSQVKFQTSSPSHESVRNFLIVQESRSYSSSADVAV